MSDLISRQDVLDVFRNLAFDHIFQCGEYYGEDERQLTIINAEKAIDVIESLPSAESEQKTGKWIEWQAPNGIDCGIECSECGYKANTYPGYGSAYCPTCGAKMEWE